MNPHSKFEIFSFVEKQKGLRQYDIDTSQKINLYYSIQELVTVRLLAKCHSTSLQLK